MDEIRESNLYILTIRDGCITGRANTAVFAGYL
jgi:hypothetical protein